MNVLRNLYVEGCQQAKAEKSSALLQKRDGLSTQWRYTRLGSQSMTVELFKCINDVTMSNDVDAASIFCFRCVAETVLTIIAVLHDSAWHGEGL